MQGWLCLGLLLSTDRFLGTPRLPGAVFCSHCSGSPGFCSTGRLRNCTAGRMPPAQKPHVTLQKFNSRATAAEQSHPCSVFTKYAQPAVFSMLYLNIYFLEMPNVMMNSSQLFTIGSEEDLGSFSSWGALFTVKEEECDILYFFLLNQALLRVNDQQ